MALFTDFMLVYITDPKNYNMVLQQLINTLSKVDRFKTNSRQSVTLLYTNDKESNQGNNRLQNGLKI